MRGRRSGGVPAMSAPSGIHTMPCGGVGACTFGAQGGAASDTSGVWAAGSCRGSRHPEQAIAVTAKPTKRRRDRSSKRVPLIALSQAEFLHLELQPFARDLQQACGMRDVTVRLLQRSIDELAL